MGGDIVDRLNCVRAAMGVSKVKYSYEVENSAYNWMKQMDPNSNCNIIKHSQSNQRVVNGVQLGENLAYSGEWTGNKNYDLHHYIIKAEDMWYDECKDYTGGDNSKG